MRWQLMLVVFGIWGCVPQDSSVSNSTPVSTDAGRQTTDSLETQLEPIAIPNNPNYKEWPALIGKRVEFVGILSIDHGKGGDGPRVFFDGTYISLSEDFYSEVPSTGVKVVGTLERVLHSGVPLGGQAGANGRVWETFVLNVEEWKTVPGSELP